MGLRMGRNDFKKVDKTLFETSGDLFRFAEETVEDIDDSASQHVYD